MIHINMTNEWKVNWAIKFQVSKNSFYNKATNMDCYILMFVKPKFLPNTANAINLIP